VKQDNCLDEVDSLCKNPPIAVKIHKAMNIIKRWEYLTVYVIFVVVVFVAHFKHCTQFGLYEDDYAHIAPGFFSDFDHFLSLIKSSIFDKRGIGYLVSISFSYFAGNIFHSLTILYIFGVFIVAVNAFFIYSSIKKYLSIPYAFLGGLIFILSPIDTTKEYLTHIYFLQISLLFSFIATFLYNRGNRFVSYFIAALSLLTYESVFIIFLFASFLSEEKEIKIRKHLKHLLLCCLVIGAILIYKALISKDDNVLGVMTYANVNPFEVIKRFVGGFVLGPFYSGFSLVHGFYLGLLELFSLNKRSIMLLFSLFLQWYCFTRKKNYSVGFTTFFNVNICYHPRYCS
jgi:hypothetical protein